MSKTYWHSIYASKKENRQGKFQNCRFKFKVIRTANCTLQIVEENHLNYFTQAFVTGEHLEKHSLIKDN